MATRTNPRAKEYIRIVFESYRKRHDVMMYLELVLSLTAIILFLIFALRPTALTISELTKDIQTKEELLTELEVKMEALEKAQSIYDHEPRIELIKQAVPVDVSPEGVVRQIETLAARDSVKINGLSFDEVAIKDSEDDESVKDLYFSVSVEGPYESISSFIASFDNLRRPVVITSIGLSNQEDSIILSISANSPYK